jgi:hypothetical protein
LPAAGGPCPSDRQYRRAASKIGRYALPAADVRRDLAHRKATYRVGPLEYADGHTAIVQVHEHAVFDKGDITKPEFLESTSGGR